MKIIEIKDARETVYSGHAKDVSESPRQGVDSIKLAQTPADRSARTSTASRPPTSVDDVLLESKNRCKTSIEALDTRAPRYTSYPTADRFVEAFSELDYQRHLANRGIMHGLPLSVYLHIPFCSELCFYCACNKTITQKYEKAIPYVERLISELNLVDRHLSGNRRLSQIHWGGGTPTYLRAPEIMRLMDTLRDFFMLEEGGEYSIEVDPRTVDREMLQLLKEQGFNRLSLGVQDFDERVQRAINRSQPVELVDQVLEDSRELGFQSTNFDLIYGLPCQSVETYRVTVESVIAMRPERIALYNYAHLPTRFKAQRLINDADMPSAEEKLAIFDMANELLDAAGYEYIGMDHFALPDDELAVAHRSGRLHRNFQGYSTQPDCDLIALGASAISRIGSCYAQNLRGVNEYSDRVAQGILPTLRGIELTRDDILRRSVIMAIMCQGEVDKGSMEIAHLIDFDSYFAVELAALKQLERLGYVQLEQRLLIVSKIGRRKALRLIAGVFDRYLADKQSRDRFSKVL